MSKQLPFTPLYGREEETKIIYNLITKGISFKKPLSIYVCGKSGTGKTETLKLISDNLSQQYKKIKCIYVCCTGCQKGVDIYHEISWKLRKKKFSSSISLRKVEEYFSNEKYYILLILDEIDFLASKNQDTLYKIFEWPEKFKGTVGVVGIANTLDLTQRFLPKLKKGAIPSKIHFEPYVKDQLVAILSETLKSELNNVDEKNILYIASKVASKDGDVRSAISIAKKSLLDLEGENKQSKKKKHLSAVISTIQNIESSPVVRAKIPYQPKIILAIILKLLSLKKIKSLNEAIILAAFKKTQYLLKLPELGRHDLLNHLNILESQSLISTFKKKINLNVDIQTAKSIISDDALLGKIEKIDF
uniref:AAA domain-containing protein n=1 Tax=Parastrongyloides trichosuri TaxID=131310 RepID=A0A0N5A2L0_PARTI